MTYHIPILLEKSAELLHINKGDVVLDCTLGGGGHTKEFLKRVGDRGVVISIDRDTDAINHVTESFGTDFPKNLFLVHANYSEIPEILKKQGISSVDKVFMDLGISSHQIDEKERGLSYNSPDSKLDMRMDRSSATTAAFVLNTYDQNKLEYIFQTYGEENFSKKITQNILDFRRKQKFEYVHDLLSCINGISHPKRCFQALRIEVNQELEHLIKTLSIIPFILKDNGLVGIITFHGLEERILKQIMKIFEKNLDPKPILQYIESFDSQKLPKMKSLTDKPIIPDQNELNENFRSKSAKLRIWQRI